MGRLVSPIRRNAAGFAVTGGGDDYPTRVAKYIPAEVVGAYLAVQNILHNTAGTCRVPSAWWYALYAFFVVITPVYLYSQRTKGEPYILNLIIGTIAFVVWSYALTDCTKFGIFFAFYSSDAAAVILIVFSLAAGLVQPQPTK
jgi:hypothetical protein